MCVTHRSRISKHVEKCERNKLHKKITFVHYNFKTVVLDDTMLFYDYIIIIFSVYVYPLPKLSPPRVSATVNVYLVIIIIIIIIII